MSRFVKNLLTEQFRSRLNGVADALLVDVAGLDANQNHTLRRELREKDVQLLMVKNSLAKRAVEGTPLATAFEQAEGQLAVLWGGEDIVSLAKIVASYLDNKEYEKFASRGGVMDGARLSPEEVKQVSKWPSREEQLSIVAGQILSPGARLSSQLLGAGAALASQIKQKADAEGEGESAAAANEG